MANFWENVKKRPYLGLTGGVIGDDFFNTKRERDTPGIINAGMTEYDNVLNSIDGMKSAFNGIGSSENVRTKFGIPKFNKQNYSAGVDAAFQPARGSLATRFARMRSDAKNRMTGSDAMPGVTFGEIDANESGAFSELEGQAATGKMRGYDMEAQNDQYVASLLRSIFGDQDQFAMQMPQLKMQALGGKNNLRAAQINSLSDDSTFDDILAMMDTGASVAKLFL